MSYKAGENVIDHSYCEADFVRSAKANVRFFIEIIIGGVILIGLLGILGSTLLGSLSCLGSCLGCEECVETAITADGCMEEMGCEDCSENYYDDMGCWEEIAVENLETANECATCEGIDCFGRQGCFASEGCGDCENCAGTLYYSVKIVVGDTTKSLEINEDQTRISVYYPSNVSSDYYKFLGYFDEGGKMYVDENGKIVKTLKQNLTLYGRYQEYRVNEAIQFELRLAELGLHDETISLTVGSTITSIPTAPEKEGYEFVGWYMDGKLVHKGNIAEGATFHLYTFGLTPYAGNGPYVLTPKYTPKTYIITFNVYGSSYQIEAEYNDTYGDIYNQFYNKYYSLQSEETFFGWGETDTTAPENRVKDDVKIESNTTLYAIFRDAVHLKFYLNRGNYDDQYLPVKLYDKQTDVYFDKLEELAYAYSEDANPGYKFAGWYTDSYVSGDDQAVDRISLVSTSITKNYYANWETTDYTIEYYAMHYDSGTLNNLSTQTYNYSGSQIELKPADEATKNYGYDFVGWCLNEDCSDTPRTTLDAWTYGNKKLYAKYAPKSFEYTWLANGGTVNGVPDGMSSIVYGQENQLPMPTRTGYDFMGWKLYGSDNVIVGNTDALVDKFTFGTLGMENTAASELKLQDEGFVLIAEWEIQKFTVTFKVDGKTYDQQTINYGEKVSEPEDPTKTGYEFMYWQNENGDQFYPQTQIIKDWTLTAYFEINKYTVIFYVDGTANIAENVQHGTTLKEAEAAVQSWCPGYADTETRRKIGWYDSDLDSATKYEEDYAIVTDELKVHVHFEYAKVFTFVGSTTGETRYYFVGEKYDATGGKYDNGVTKPNIPVGYQPGYDFLGWGTSESGSTVAIENGAEVRIKDSTATTYYPKFKAIVYNITYYLGNTVHDTDTYTVEDEKQLISVYDSNAPTKYGYTFVGWVVDSNGNYDYSDEYRGAGYESVLVTQLIENTGDKKYLAAFDNNVYDVTLRNEGGNYTLSVTFDKAFDFGLPADREGCDFEGWAWKEYDNDAINKVIVTNENGVSKGVYDYDGDRDAYPVFKRKQYAFFWCVDGSSVTTTYQKHFDTTVTKPVDPKKEGYTFVGWYEDAALTQEYDFTHEVVGEEHIYAKFVINEYTVKFKVGNEIKKTVTLNYNTSLSSAINDAQYYATAYATEQSAHFKHWKDEETGMTYSTSSVVPAKNLTLVATYDMPIYLIFNANGGVITGNGQEKIMKGPFYASAYEGVPSVTRQGYTFLGWYENNVDKVGSTVSVTGSETAKTEKTYVAKWEANKYNIYYYIDGVYQQSSEYSMDQTEVSGGFKLWDGGDKVGYTLKGWYTSSYYSGTELKAIDNTGKSEGSKTATDLYLYAKWERETYTITIKNADGTQYTTMNVQYGTSLSALTWVSSYAETYNPGGKIFAGFVKEGTTKAWVSSTGKWNVDTATMTEDIVLVARWY